MSGRRIMPEPAWPKPQEIPPVDPSLIMHSTDAAEDPQTAGVATMASPTEMASPIPGPPVPPPGDEDPGEALSPEEEINFASLLTCGRRSKTLHILDHTVVVETLCGSDDLRIGAYVKQYTDTSGEQRAYHIAVAAASLRSIDGRPVVQGLFQGADEDALFDQKIKIVEKMYPTVIAAIYRGTLGTEREFLELVNRLGKSFG